VQHFAYAEGDFSIFQPFGKLQIFAYLRVFVRRIVTSLTAPSAAAAAA
jgi:hypothetical protein